MFPCCVFDLPSLVDVVWTRQGKGIAPCMRVFLGCPQSKNTNVRESLVRLAGAVPGPAILTLHQFIERRSSDSPSLPPLDDITSGRRFRFQSSWICIGNDYNTKKSFNGKRELLAVGRIHQRGVTQSRE